MLKILFRKNATPSTVTVVKKWGSNTYLIDANPKKGDVILTAGDPNGPFTLTINTENGSVTKNPDLDKYDKGTEVELTAVPENDNFVFIEWTGDINSKDNPLTRLIHKLPLILFRC